MEAMPWETDPAEEVPSATRTRAPVPPGNKGNAASHATLTRGVLTSIIHLSRGSAREIRAGNREARASLGHQPSLVHIPPSKARARKGLWEGKKRYPDGLLPPPAKRLNEKRLSFSSLCYYRAP